MSNQPSGSTPDLVPPGWASMVRHTCGVADRARIDGANADVQAAAHIEAATAIESDELHPYRDTGWSPGWRTGLPDWLAAVLDEAAAHHRDMARRIMRPAVLGRPQPGGDNVSNARDVGEARQALAGHGDLVPMLWRDEDGIGWHVRLDAKLDAEGRAVVEVIPITPAPVYPVYPDEDA